MDQGLFGRGYDIIDPSDFSTIKNDVLSHSLRSYSNNSNYNANLNRVSIVPNPQAPGSVIGVVHKMQVRPSKNRIVNTGIQYLSQDELESFQFNMEKMRISDMAAPYLDGTLDDELVKPKYDVHHANDFYVFDEGIDSLLKGTGSSVELIARDIAGTNNISVYDLNKEVQSGMDGVERRKIEATRTRNRFISQASKVIDSINEQEPNMETMTMAEIYNYIDGLLETATLGEALSKVVYAEMNHLYSIMEMAGEAVNTCESESIETFSESLVTPGYNFSSLVTGVDSLLDEFGVGSRDFLALRY